jgi:peptidoglycan/LPS O-acetylase OafA/YrhL
MGSLRLFLALAVVGSHAEILGLSKILTGGEAVQLFFVISGFYMALILEKKYHSVPLFYSNRFLRLYPTYVLVLFGAVIWFLIEWAYTHHRPPPFWIADANAQMPIWQWLALQLSNLSMIGLDLPALFHWKPGQGFLFLYGDTETTPDGAEWGGRLPWITQAWSVGSEIWFYLLAPFILRRSILVQSTVAIVSFAIMFLMQSPLAYFFFPANLWLFLVGSLLYQIFRSRHFAPPVWSGYLALAYVLLAGCSIGAASNRTVHVIILSLMALCIPLLFNAFSNSRWDTTIANLSYPVYLVHILIISILVATFRIHSGLFAAIASVSAAILIVHFIENPIDQYRQRRASRSAAPSI